MDDGEGKTTEAELEGEEDEQRRAEVTQSRRGGEGARGQHRLHRLQGTYFRKHRFKRFKGLIN